MIIFHIYVSVFYYLFKGSIHYLPNISSGVAFWNRKGMSNHMTLQSKLISSWEAMKYVWSLKPSLEGGVEAVQQYSIKQNKWIESIWPISQIFIQFSFLSSQEFHHFFKTVSNKVMINTTTHFFDLDISSDYIDYTITFFIYIFNFLLFSLSVFISYISSLSLSAT